MYRLNDKEVTKEELINAIDDLIKASGEVKYSFLTGRCEEEIRKWNEKKLSRKLTFYDGVYQYDCKLDLQRVNNHIFIIKDYYRNGKKTNINAIKGSYNRLTTN